MNNIMAGGGESTKGGTGQNNSYRVGILPACLLKGDKKMTVEEIVIEKLRELGADGLCIDECGCGLDDFMPCEEGCGNCVPGVKGFDDEGAEIFVPMGG